MKNINIKSILFFVLILLLILNYSCRKTVTCSPPDESTIKAMEAKWIHYNKNDTLILISNKNDTNILNLLYENKWYEEDNENTYAGYPCGYVHGFTFKSTDNKYSSITYVMYESNITIYFHFFLKSNNSVFDFDKINPDITYYDSLVFNNKPFYEVYKFQNTLPTYEYDVYFSHSDGLIKISVNNDSLYFMPKEYW